MPESCEFTISLPPETLDQLRGLAQARRMTMPDLVRDIVRQHLNGEHLERPAHDRRTHERRQVSVPSVVEIHFPPDDILYTSGTLTDISLGGVCIEFPKRGRLMDLLREDFVYLKIICKAPGEEETSSFECESRRMRDLGDTLMIGAAFREQPFMAEQVRTFM